MVLSENLPLWSTSCGRGKLDIVPMCFRTVMLEKTLDSLLDYKEITPVHPKGNQPWIYTGRADAEAPILWPPDMKTQLIGKDPDAGKDSRQEEKGLTEDEMVGWHHRLNEHEFEQAPEDGEGQGSLASYHPWGSQSVGHSWAGEHQQPLETLRLTD